MISEERCATGEKKVPVAVSRILSGPASLPTVDDHFSRPETGRRIRLRGRWCG
jgi:hypothetical protein